MKSGPVKQSNITITLSNVRWSMSLGPIARGATLPAHITLKTEPAVMVVWHGASQAVTAVRMPGWHGLSCLQQKPTVSMPCSIQAGELPLQEAHLQRNASAGSCPRQAMVPALLAVIVNAGSSISTGNGGEGHLRPLKCTSITRKQVHGVSLMLSMIGRTLVFKGQGWAAR